MKVRRYQPGEEAEIRQLFVDTTHNVNSKDYTRAQIDRWAPETYDHEAWVKRLGRTNPFVAVDGEKIVGFVELEADGHIDCFYCHHAWQRRGVGRAMFRAVEHEARSLGIGELYAEVSVTAEPFFTAMGFRLESERAPVICGAPAKQFLMRKVAGT